VNMDPDLDLHFRVLVQDPILPWLLIIPLQVPSPPSHTRLTNTYTSTLLAKGQPPPAFL
jgi:hypothetical protein